VLPLCSMRSQHAITARAKALHPQANEPTMHHTPTATTGAGGEGKKKKKKKKKSKKKTGEGADAAAGDDGAPGAAANGAAAAAAAPAAAVKAPKDGKQTDPPTIPVRLLFPDGKFPEGEWQVRRRKVPSP